MRKYKLILCVTLVGFVGAASARAPDRDDRRDDNTYSAGLFYRYDFGGPAIAHPHQLGLRFDGDRRDLHGTPILQTSLNGSGVANVQIRGVTLPGIALAAGQEEAPGFWASLSVGEWVAVGFTAIVVGATVSSSAKSNDHPAVSGGS